MRKIFLFSLLVITFACSKEEKKLELFSPEAFAYSLDGGWELNLSCQTKGYSLYESKGEFYTKLSFVIDLKKSDGTTIKNIQSGKLEQQVKEKDTDLQLNSQIKLDSTYVAGTYNAVINIKDELSGKTSKIEKQFDL